MKCFRHSPFLFGLTIAFAIALSLLVWPRPVSAAPTLRYLIDVTTATDEYDVSGDGTGCSLREAIKAANDGANFGGCNRVSTSGSGADTIVLASGTYTLTLNGSGEDLDAAGDLDIRNSMIIGASGATPPIVTGDPNWADRIFHILIGTATINGIVIRGGWEADTGGGAMRIESGAALSLNDSMVADSFAIGKHGGGIYNNSGGTLLLNDVVLSGNSTTGSTSHGGGIYNAAGVVTLANVTLSGNHATGAGGGIYSFGTLSLTNVTLSSNSAAVYGGGISNEGGTLTVTASTLSGNSSPYYGGGLFNNLGSPLLTNVTLSGNSASLAGGGLFNNSGTPHLTNVTLSGNSAKMGGGISSGVPLSLTNTVVANSPSGGNCSKAFGGARNLSSDNTCGFGAGGDNVNLLLSPLGPHGGPTLTHLPLPGSPAIDFGTDTGCPPTDQRGQPRPAGLRCDVGAVELQATEIRFVYLPLMRR